MEKEDSEAMIDKVHTYYGIAIRSNVGTLAEMKRAIYASLFHVASSQANKWHSHCHMGSDSWCLYQQDMANEAL